MNKPFAGDVKGKILEALKPFDDITLLMVFGSVAAEKVKQESDIDIALLTGSPLTVQRKIEMIEALAMASGRPVDLVDLRTAGEPLIGEILQHGRILLGEHADFAALLSRHLLDQSDFVPYQARILRERREAWINS